MGSVIGLFFIIVNSLFALYGLVQEGLCNAEKLNVFECVYFYKKFFAFYVLPFELIIAALIIGLCLIVFFVKHKFFGK